MLTKQEYEEIVNKISNILDGLWDSSFLRDGAKLMAEKTVNVLIDYIKDEQQVTGIDCAALNKALKEGKIRFVWSMDGGVAFVPGKQKSDHDIMFENVLNNAENKMYSIEQEYYFKEMCRHCGILIGDALKATEHSQKLMKKYNTGCYVKTDETEKEQWDRLDGHQKCMKSASDVAYGEQNKNRILKSGFITIEKNQDGKYTYVDKTKEEPSGVMRDVLSRLRSLEEGFGTIAGIILEYGNVGMFNELQNNITKLREMTEEQQHDSV